jgi:membrane-associated phospholipid phosphatase
VTLIEQADRAIALAANQFAGLDILLDRSVHDVLVTALPSGGVFVAALCWIWFEADGTGSHAHRRDVVTALLAVMVVAVAVFLLKALLPYRVRPLNTPDLGLRVAFGVDPASVSALGAFPSGHAAIFFALCVPLWMRSRWLGAAAAAWASLTVCLPLLYRGEHWLTDIVAGAVIGVSLMLLLCRCIATTAVPDRVLRFSASHPPVFYVLAWLLALEISGMFGDVQAYMRDAALLARALLS